MGSLDFVILRPNAVAASNIGPGDSHSPGPNPKPARWLEKGKKKPCLAQKRIKTGLVALQELQGAVKKNPASLRRGLRPAPGSPARKPIKTKKTLPRSEED